SLVRLFTVFPPAGGLGTFNALRLRSRLAVVPVDPRPQVRIHLTTIGELLENSARLDLTDPVVVNRLERLVEATVAAEIAHAIESVQKRGTDVFGFGFALFKRDPRAWRERWAREWDRVFPTLPRSEERRVGEAC